MKIGFPVFNCAGIQPKKDECITSLIGHPLNSEGQPAPSKKKPPPLAPCAQRNFCAKLRCFCNSTPTFVIKVNMHRTKRRNSMMTNKIPPWVFSPNNSFKKSTRKQIKGFCGTISKKLSNNHNNIIDNKQTTIKQLHLGG